MAIKDEKYGEVVGAFLRPREQPWSAKPDFEEVRTWVRKTLGSHKAPNYVFWVSEEGFQDFPKTGSGKYQKHILRDIGDRIVKTRKQNVRARL